uniref:Candidate secreted effector n=1 Tax=Meloidogyne incognita TaxID=6306 RepID=A0A914LMF4_MELIC
MPRDVSVLFLSFPLKQKMNGWRKTSFKGFSIKQVCKTSLLGYKLCKTRLQT